MPRSDASSADIGWRAAEPQGGSRRPDTGRSAGSGIALSHRYRSHNSVAGKAAPAATAPVMINTHTGVLHDAKTAVTATQKPVATVKNTPSRSAQRRLRNSLARGSEAALSLSAIAPDTSAAVSMPRCRKDRAVSGRLVLVAMVHFRYRYWPSGFSGVAWVESAAGAAGVAVPPLGRASPRIEARICSNREWPAICTLAC